MKYILLMVAICAATLTTQAQTFDTTLHYIKAAKIAPRWAKMGSPKADRLEIRQLGADDQKQELYYAMHLYTSDSTSPILLLHDNEAITGDDLQSFKASTNPTQFIYQWFAAKYNIILQ